MVYVKGWCHIFAVICTRCYMQVISLVNLCCVCYQNKLNGKCAYVMCT